MSEVIALLPEQSPLKTNYGMVDWNIKSFHVAVEAKLNDWFYFAGLKG